MNDGTHNPFIEKPADEDVPEFMSEMVQELEYIPRNERLGRAGRLKRNGNVRWLLAIAVAAVVLMVVMATAFQSGEDSDALATSLARIEGRLKALEGKIARIEENIAPEMLQNKAPSTRSQPRERFHTVRSGDTLSGIAGKYGLTVAVLCKLNQLTVDEPIKPDQKLLVSPD